MATQPKEENPYSNLPKKKLVRSASRSVSYSDLSQVEVPEGDPTKLINLGVCAMDKKLISDAMTEILKRLNEPPPCFNLIIFQEELIFRKKINEWPVVEALITFYSDGFPFQKVKEYCELRKPFLINDIKKQEILWNRMLVYKELKKAGIPTPNHFFVKRDYSQNLCHKKIQQIYDKTPPEKLIGDLNKQSAFLDCSTPFIGKSRANSIDEEIKSKQNITVNASPDPLFLASPNMNHIQSLTLEEISIQGSASASLAQVQQFDDYITINGIKLNKPIVEKPFDAEDHNIHIYYPMNVGGGCKKLFRKVGNSSSIFDACSNEIRQEGNYIYEEFLPTDGFDIKVYTVGPDYAHAEARKSPALDGKVERSKSGKEFRYPVNLTAQEKILARKVVLWFGQNICGFDLLRSKGKSYVCDVNGWSFVKGNSNYYRDCSWILKRMILKELAPKRLLDYELEHFKGSSKGSFGELVRGSTCCLLGKEQLENTNNVIASLFRPNELLEARGEELRSIVAVFRHGDRTPKQKMKMIVSFPEILEFFADKEDIHTEIKLKKAVSLQKMLDITRDLLDRVRKGEVLMDDSESEDDYHENMRTKLLQLQSILEKGGHFDEINRKIQLRPLKFAKVVSNGVEEERVVQALLILKWGGELTHSGEEQAESYGTQFRAVYNDSSEGILRLHNSYRHDLKIYASDEGRCIKTAASFCKGFLNLEGELTPIAVSMVRKDDLSQELLDFRAHDLAFLNEIKKELADMLNKNETLRSTFAEKHGEKVYSESLGKIIDQINHPCQMMKSLHWNIRELTNVIGEDVEIKEKTYYIGPKDMSLPGEAEDLEKMQKFIGCGQENIILIFKRWRKLEIDFFDKKKGIFNISKIPDINDSIKYDTLHNYPYFRSQRLNEISVKIFYISELLASFVVPYEYGSSPLKKTEIGMKIIRPLFNKIKSDLLWWTTALAEKNDLAKPYQEESSYYMMKNKDMHDFWRHIRTRLYFTSASHVYSLFNVLHYNAGGASLKQNRKAFDEIVTLQYLTHIVFKLYENLDANEKDPKRFRLEVVMSPGCVMDGEKRFEDHLVPIVEPKILNENLSLEELELLFKNLKFKGEKDKE